MDYTDEICVCGHRCGAHRVSEWECVTLLVPHCDCKRFRRAPASSVESEPTVRPPKRIWLSATGFKPAASVLLPAIRIYDEETHDADDVEYVRVDADVDIAHTAVALYGNRYPVPTAGEWEVHEGDDYIVVLGEGHDHTDDPIARFYERGLADKSVAAVNAYDANRAIMARLEAENLRLREALQPFTQIAKQVPANFPDSGTVTVYAGVVRAAHAALSP